jgi:hypothetical protein
MSDTTSAQEVAAQAEQRRMLKWLLQPVPFEDGEYPIRMQATEIGNKLALAVLLQPDKVSVRDEYTTVFELYESDATLKVTIMASPGGYGLVPSDDLELRIENRGTYTGTREAYEALRYYSRDGSAVTSEWHSCGATYGVSPPHLELFNRFWEGTTGKRLTQAANELRTEFGIAIPQAAAPVNSKGQDPLSPSFLAAWLMSPNNGRANFANSYGADLVRGRALTTAVLAMGQEISTCGFFDASKAWTLELPSRAGQLIVTAQAKRGWSHTPDKDSINLLFKSPNDGLTDGLTEGLFFMERCYTPDKSGAAYATRLEMGQHDTRSVVASWYKATRQGQAGRQLKAKLGQLAL